MSEREKIIETMVSALAKDDKNWAGWKNTSSGILAALDAAGYDIVKREPDEAMLRAARSAKMTDSVPVMDWIGTANKGECESLGIPWPEHPHDRAGVIDDDVCDLVSSATWRAMIAAQEQKP
jgi:hypothetical protein